MPIKKDVLWIPQDRLPWQSVRPEAGALNLPWQGTELDVALLQSCKTRQGPVRRGKFPNSKWAQSRWAVWWSINEYLWGSWKRWREAPHPPWGNTSPDQCYKPAAVEKGKMSILWKQHNIPLSPTNLVPGSQKIGSVRAAIWAFSWCKSRSSEKSSCGSLFIEKWSTFSCQGGKMRKERIPALQTTWQRERCIKCR